MRRSNLTLCVPRLSGVQLKRVTPFVASLAFIVTGLPLPAHAADDPWVAQTGFVESGGEQIYFESVGAADLNGAGDPVVLCHGLGGNHAIWYQQVPVFAQNYRVITWDQRGFGRSTNTQNQNSPAAAADDLKAVLDHLGIDRAHLVGQSMGGWAVVGFTLKHPDRVRSLVLADTIGGIFTPEATAHFDAYIQSTVAAPPPDQQPITRHPAIGNQIGGSDPAKAFLYRQIGSVAPPAPRNAGLQLRQTSYPLEDIRKLQTPVLLVVGEDDPIFPPDVVLTVKEQLQNAQMASLPGTGHSPYFEDPSRWNRIVVGFLSRTE